MVSNRHKISVREELKKLKLHIIIFDLGEIDVMENLSSTEREQLKIKLLKS